MIKRNKNGGYAKGYKMPEKTKKRVSEARKKYFAKGKRNIKERSNTDEPWLKSLINIGKRIYCRGWTYRRKGITSDLTEEQLKKLWFRDKAYNLVRPSLDRKDNDGNYTYKNCKYVEFNFNCKRTNMDNSYNKGRKITPEWRLKISRSVSKLWKDPTYRKMMIEAHRKIKT